MIRRSLLSFCLGAALLLGARLALADSATVAAAANFITPLAELEKLFEERTEHDLTIVSGSTGQLYAQVANGAPFDVFLSADREHAERLAAEGLGDGSTRFTYAIGTLALWTRDAEKFRPLNLDALRRADFRWLAIANPELAPYGLAAQQALQKLGLWDSLQARIVRGENIAQTFTMAETRNADLAFVALSQAIAYGETAAYFIVPAELHDAISQDAIVLRRGGDNAAARAFVDFLRSADAAQVIERFGYARP
jgi:molybdate transport system substrate-binding protein